MQTFRVRKKIGAVSLFLQRNLTDLLPLCSLFFCYFLGFLIGYASAGKIDPGRLLSFASVWSSLSVGKLTIVSLTIYIGASVMVILSGASLFGFVVVPMLTAVYGAVCGMSVYTAYAIFHGKELFLLLVTVLPVCSAFGAVLIQYGKTAALLSCEILACHRDRSATPKTTIGTYLSAAVILILVGCAAAVLQSVCIRSFAKIT